MQHNNTGTCWGAIHATAYVCMNNSYPYIWRQQPSFYLSPEEDWEKTIQEYLKPYTKKGVETRPTRLKIDDRRERPCFLCELVWEERLTLNWRDRSQNIGTISGVEIQAGPMFVFDNVTATGREAITRAVEQTIRYCRKSFRINTYSLVHLKEKGGKTHKLPLHYEHYPVIKVTNLS